MGNRWVYSVVDIADYFLQPKYFGVNKVDFKVGSELTLLNFSLSIIRTLKRVTGTTSIGWLTSASRGLVSLMALFGTSQGSVMVEVSGRSPEGSSKIFMSVLAEQHGEIIPAILPSLAAQMILQRQIASPGIVPLAEWLSSKALAHELKERQVKIVINRGAGWTDVHGS